MSVSIPAFCPQYSVTPSSHNIKRAAMGFRVHSGWAAAVVVSKDSGPVEIIERRRVNVTRPDSAGASQPYHFAEKMKLRDAEDFLRNCRLESNNLARANLRGLLHDLHRRQVTVAHCAVVLASGRLVPALERILASHALIHAAEGEFFREVFRSACTSLALSVTGIRERQLEERFRKKFGTVAALIKGQLSTMGRSIGPPWTTDQKMAALAALLVLPNKA